MGGDKIKKKKHKAIMVAIYTAIIIAIAFIWNTFLFSLIKVSGESMMPALRDGDIIIVNKLAYVFSDVERFDIVAFPNHTNDDVTVIKRVIGLPGEKIEIRDSIIYINDEEFKEYYGIYDTDTIDLYKDYGPVILKEDEYFVLGDNRCHSIDSRSDDIGKVKIEDIKGCVSFRIWPWNAIGHMEGQ